MNITPKSKKSKLNLERLHKLEIIFCNDKYIRRMKLKKLALDLT